jgi:type IV secretion system protein TrbL
MMLECYLGATIAVLLLPCDAFRQLAFLSEKAIGYVLAQGVKLAVLAFIVSAALPVFTNLSLPTHPSIEQGLSLALAVGFLLSLAWKGPAWTYGILAGSPVFSAGSVAHTAVADRALAGATAAGGTSTAGATLRGIGTGIQAGQGLIGAARGRTTRHNRQPPDGEQDLASFDASAAPRRPGGVSCQSYDSS